MQIRRAAHDDLVSINDIYNYYVLHSTATYQTDPETFDARRAWFEHHTDQYSVIVATDERGTVIGWGVAQPFSSPRRRFAHGGKIRLR